MTVTVPWRLGVRMYHVTDDLAQAWNQLLVAMVDKLRQRGWTEEMEIDPCVDDLASFWAAPNLLLGQTCGYPLVTSLASKVHVVGTPVFRHAYCDGMRYSSLLLVHQYSGLHSLEDLRGKLALVNGLDSHSGMNALRHSVAPLARDGRFFGSVRATGGHRESLVALQRREADVACVDSAHYGYALRDAPERVTGLRVLHVTAHAPGLPFIASRYLSEPRLQQLRRALLELPAERPDLMLPLAIASIEPTTLAQYEQILDMERQAVALGYPALA